MRRRRFFWQALILAVVLAGAALIGSAKEELDLDLGVPGLITFAVLSAVGGVVSLTVFGAAPALRDRGAGVPAGQSSPLFVTAEQPPSSSRFRGRQAELERLHRIHQRERLRRDRGDPDARGPVVLVLHGPAGVGKSALAQELARQLREKYPDGLVSANFGASGAPRGAADITRDMLLRLGWQEHEVPRDADDRVATLRSLSRNRRILFLFDAVRDHDQLNQVMPAGVRCCVIITSRPHLATPLGLPPQQPLGRLTFADGLEILQSVARIDNWLADAPTAVEIVELCDRLPLALLAAADRIAAGASPRHVAELLRDPNLRLRALDYNTRSVRERVDAELSRLLPKPHDLLVALSQLDSATFVPWVVGPLLGPDLRPGEGQSMLAGLAAAQLLEPAGLDETGQPRYRVSALVRLVARRHHDHAAIDLAQARARLDDAYVELLDEVMALRDPTYHRSYAQQPRPVVVRGAQRILPHLDSLVRREYLSLVRLITVAELPRYGELVWRAAALLDDRVPALADHHALGAGMAGSGGPHAMHSAILGAFDRALVAAGADVLAEVDVRLARAQFLGAVERHGEAQRELDRVDEVLNGITEDPAAGAGSGSLSRRLRAARVRATTFVQFGAFLDGNQAIAHGEQVIRQLGPSAATDPYVSFDVELLKLLNAAAERVDPDVSVTTGSTVPEAVAFRRDLEESENLRRQGFHGAAATVLLALVGRDGDVRGRALLRYRLSRLHVGHAMLLLQRTVNGDHRPNGEPSGVPGESVPDAILRLARDGVEAAAAAVVDFGRIGDIVGTIRARCQLLRALVVAGQTIVATHLSIEIAAELAQLSAADYLRDPLTGRHDRARGEVQISRRSYREAWRSLTAAAAVFRGLHDWRNHAQTLRIMERLDTDELREALGDPF